MKDWIGQAGMLSAAGFVNSASCLNLSCLKRDKQSAITLLAPSMCTIYVTEFAKRGLIHASNF